MYCEDARRGWKGKSLAGPRLTNQGGMVCPDDSVHQKREKLVCAPHHGESRSRNLAPDAEAKEADAQTCDTAAERREREL